MWTCPHVVKPIAMPTYAYFIFNNGILVRVLVDEDGDYDSAEAWQDGRFVEASVLIPDILMKGGVMEISEETFWGYIADRDPGPSSPGL